MAKEVHYNGQEDGGLPLRQERAAVRRGAKLLDRLLPGWYKQVDLKALDMADGSLCMMGQLFETESELAEEMYPEEIEAARKATRQGWYNVSPCGWRIATGDSNKKQGAIFKIMKKLGLDKHETRRKEHEALRHVCSGHDNACLWAEEIADRIAVEKG